MVLYNAVFEVPNAEGRLMTQMTAQVFFINNAARDALLVPVTALQQRGPQATVQVMGEDGEPRERQVTVGVTNRVQAEILDGLEEGERIVSSPRTAGGQGDDSRARRMVGMRF